MRGTSPCSRPSRFAGPLRITGRPKDALTSGMLAGLSVAAVGVAASAQAASPARPLRRAMAGRRLLTPRDFMATPQSPWKFCAKCKILYWGPEHTSSVCPAGGTHGGPTAEYTMLFS